MCAFHNFFEKLLTLHTSFVISYIFEYITYYIIDVIYLKSFKLNITIVLSILKTLCFLKLV